VAQNLLGKLIICGNLVGRIVETEAYLSNDEASHSFVGKTKRNSQMFSRPGTAYVYFTYGMHHCFNIATAPQGIGEAVLIRAVEPLKGIGQMRKNRGIEKKEALCNGPAKFCKAFGIDLSCNGIYLLKKSSKIILADDSFAVRIRKGKRIGISRAKELPLRFFVDKSNFLSRN